MRLFDTSKPMFEAHTEKGVRVYVSQGGTSSGKTYVILQILISKALQESKSVITVAGQDIPNLRAGAVRDIKTIIGNCEQLTKLTSFNESTFTLNFINGSIIEFKSYENEQDAKSGKRDYLFVNEANGITYPVYWQLAIRTRKKIWIDYNPSTRFWVHDEVIGRKDTKLIISDHRQNPFLTQGEHDRIENIEDPDLWNVYARGRTGKLTGLILTNYEIIDNDKMPDFGICKIDTFGMDFGFTNDPTAVERVCYYQGELYIDEYIYSTQLTNPDIASKCMEKGVTRRMEIIADSAEMKSIAELRNLGLWVNPSVKGRDSIINGLDILKRYKLNITRRSVGLREELNGYKWKVDKDGKDTNVPIDKLNHAIDAIRYVALVKLNARRKSSYHTRILNLDKVC